MQKTQPTTKQEKKIQEKKIRPENVKPQILDLPCKVILKT